MDKYGSSSKKKRNVYEIAAKEADDYKLRVAAYCRVSTYDLDQINSLEAQQRHFERLIKENPEWELAGIYA